MFEGADRRIAEQLLRPRLAMAYTCAYCGNDKRTGPFIFLGRKRIVGCCRVSVAERSGVSPGQVQISHAVKAASPRHWPCLWDAD